MPLHLALGQVGLPHIALASHPPLEVDWGHARTLPIGRGEPTRHGQEGEDPWHGSMCHASC